MFHLYPIIYLYMGQIWTGGANSVHSKFPLKYNFPKTKSNWLGTFLRSKFAEYENMHFSEDKI